MGTFRLAAPEGFSTGVPVPAHTTGVFQLIQDRWQVTAGLLVSIIAFAYSDRRDYLIKTCLGQHSYDQQGFSRI
jgi:hypothetical protein